MGHGIKPSALIDSKTKCDGVALREEDRLRRLVLELPGRHTNRWTKRLR